MEKEIMDRVDQLIGFVQAKSPLVWEAFYRQQIMEGIINGIVFIIGLIILFTGFYIVKTEPEWAVDSDNNNVGGIIFTVVGTFVTIIAGVIFFAEGLLQILNPVYYALMALKP